MTSLFDLSDTSDLPASLRLSRRGEKPDWWGDLIRELKPGQTITVDQVMAGYYRKYKQLPASRGAAISALVKRTGTMVRRVGFGLYERTLDA